MYFAQIFALFARFDDFFDQLACAIIGLAAVR